jgi:hypothetical protein
MQLDGNFVLYENGIAYWNVNGGTQMAVQGDANLVLSSNGKAIWGSGPTSTC